MKFGFKRVLTIVVCMVMLVTSSFYTSALTESEKNKLNSDIAALKQEAAEIQSEINRLKGEKNSQGAVLNAIRKKIANTQAQISRCNEEIQNINATIAANKAEIAKMEAEIEDDKLTFKKRIRAIYMSNSDSPVKILLGADNFSSFLQMAQMTASVSAQDKKIVEKLTAAIDEINKKNEEQQKLIDQQVSIKDTIAAKQNELEAQENDAAAVYNDIAAEQKENQADVDAINAQVRKLQKQLEDSIVSQNYSSFINSNTGLQWPISGFYNISAGYHSNDAVHKGTHYGIDIAGGGIAGQPIRAIADGYVTLAHNGCTHNYKKYGNCCGNGYGNYCVVNHGTLTINGTASNYAAYYAHAQKIIVSNGQYVKQGDVLGYVGTTGWSTGYHLHLGIVRNGSWINPYPLFF